jgi:hypothetical protein
MLSFTLISGTRLSAVEKIKSKERSDKPLRDTTDDESLPRFRKRTQIAADAAEAAAQLELSRLAASKKRKTQLVETSTKGKL